MLGAEGWRVFLVVTRSLGEQGPWEDLCMGTGGGGYEYGLGWVCLVARVGRYGLVWYRGGGGERERCHVEKKRSQFLF